MSDWKPNDWKPSAVGDLFWLVMPNGSRMLQRVSHFESPDYWGSKEASLDVLSEAADDLPEYRTPRR